MKTIPHLPSFLRRVTCVAVLASLAALTYTAIRQVQTPVALRHGERANPWRGLPGCLMLKNSVTAAVTYWPLAQGMDLACPAGAIRASGHAVPAHAQPLTNALYRLIAPPPDARTPDAETVTVGGQTIAKSANVTLTLDPVATQLANTLASCLTTGSEADCRAVQIDPKRFAYLHEGAGARMLALVDMRIDNGAVEALASAHSGCFAAMLSKPGQVPAADQPSDCPTMPQQYLQGNAWRNDNHALYNQAMWASLVKPALALALLRGGAVQTTADFSWLRNALKTSDTPAFLDRIFCKSKAFAKECLPLAKLGRAGLDLGYTGGYLTNDRLQSPDLLQGSASQLITPAPHWLERATTKSESPWQQVDTDMPQHALLQDCGKRKWSQCRGEHLAELASHAWGQSDGKATPVAAAAVFARLGAAANHTGAGFGLAYKPTLQLPHAQILPVESRFAAVILQGMAQTHTQGGTAHSACVAVWGSAAACNQITTLAGKTGTPTMPHDALTLAQRSSHCDSVAARLLTARDNQTRPAAQDSVENARCAYAPYKWYVALAKDSAAPGAPWTRVVAVQIERNWSTGVNGHVDAAFDKGINLAAFAAMHYLRLRQANARQVVPLPAATAMSAAKPTGA
nr:hypothetical protein [Rhodoferax sp.]